MDGDKEDESPFFFVDRHLNCCFVLIIVFLLELGSNTHCYRLCRSHGDLETFQLCIKRSLVLLLYPDRDNLVLRARPRLYPLFFLYIIAGGVSSSIAVLLLSINCSAEGINMRWNP